MNTVLTRGRRAVTAVASLALGAGLALSLPPAPTTALSAAASPADRPQQPVAAPRGPAAKALAQALPARLGTLSYTSVYGAVPTKSSTGKKLTLSLSASRSSSGKPSFYLSLSRGQGEQHAWQFPAAGSSFKISSKAAGSLTLKPPKTGGMGKIAVKVKPDGAMKSQKCGGTVYAKTRNVKISGTVFFDTGSSWGKVGSKTRPVTFKTTHRAYFSYDVTCPPVDYPDTCYTSLSWSTSRSTAKTYTYVNASKQGSRSSVYAYRTTRLAKPAGASRSDSAWGSGGAPVLNVAADRSASMEVHGVKGSGTLADPDPASDSDDPCDTGTQHVAYWFGATMTNSGTPLKVPAQAFGAFTVPDGTQGSMSRATFD